MGHTVKTHEEFYELPIDVYQTAKVSKMLLMIENGVPVEHKGKSLSEIDIDFQYAEETGVKELQNHYDDGLHSQVNDDEELPEINRKTFDMEFEGESSGSSNKANISKKKERRETLTVDYRNTDDIGLVMEQEEEENLTEGEPLIEATLSKKRERRNSTAVNHANYNETDVIIEQEKEEEMGKEYKIMIRKRKSENVDEGGQKRKGWSPQKVSLLKKSFFKYLAKNIYPPMADIRKFLDDNRILREPATVKSKLQHLIKLKNTKK